MAMSSSYGNSFQFDPSTLPDCLRTKLRSKLLLSVYALGIVTLSDLEELEFKKSTSHRMLKEFIREGYVVQRHQLYKITEKGKDIVSYLVLYPPFQIWVERLITTQKEEILTRPKIQEIN